MLSKYIVLYFHHRTPAGRATKTRCSGAGRQRRPDAAKEKTLRRRDFSGSVPLREFPTCIGRRHFAMEDKMKENLINALIMFGEQNNWIDCSISNCNQTG